jgi:hypothetical protein
MLEFSEVQLGELIVHQVGNKLQEEGCTFSKSPLPLDDEHLSGLLLKYFLTPFKGSEFHHFHHDSDLALHELNSYCRRLFEEPDSLVEQSTNMAQHLYNQSMHHKVKAGELYVCYLRNCVVDGELMDAIGLFKSETKDTFLQVNPSGDHFSISADTGININKLDKGCLVFNTDQESGYRVAIVDTTNREEARYWREDFLALRPRQDNYHHTQHYLNLCKSFATEQMPKDFETVRADEIDLLNKSAKYFKEKDVFDLNEFSDEVLAQPELVDSFKQYKTEYQKSHALEIKDEFSISEAAVKKGGKVFKSILKLDKNFHVYIHGNRDLIERGVDEVTGMKYYKLFFTKEE